MARTSPSTVRRWLYGYEAPGHRMRPVFGKRTAVGERRPEISFLVLAELLVAAAFRKKRIRLERIRRAHDYAREHFGVEYPFAHLRFETDGRHILYRFQQEEAGESLLALDQYGQWTLPGDVVDALESFEFEDELASRWFPLGKDVPIVVDPRFGAGKPTIVNRGVTVETLQKRWQAGQTIAFLAQDFRLDKGVVELALQKAESLAA